MPAKPHDVTELLVNWSNGDQSAADKLFPLVYDELKRMARRYLRREKPGHTANICSRHGHQGCRASQPINGVSIRSRAAYTRHTTNRFSIHARAALASPRHLPDT